MRDETKSKRQERGIREERETRLRQWNSEKWNE